MKKRKNLLPGAASIKNPDPGRKTTLQKISVFGKIEKQIVIMFPREKAFTGGIIGVNNSRNPFLTIGSKAQKHFEDYSKDEIQQLFGFL
jgi:hypothetical protein